MILSVYSMHAAEKMYALWPADPKSVSIDTEWIDTLVMNYHFVQSSLLQRAEFFVYKFHIVARQCIIFVSTLITSNVMNMQLDLYLIYQTTFLQDY